MGIRLKLLVFLPTTVIIKVKTSPSYEQCYKTGVLQKLDGTKRHPERSGLNFTEEQL
jgi:hypothetical protein